MALSSSTTRILFSLFIACARAAISALFAARIAPGHTDKSCSGTNFRRFALSGLGRFAGLHLIEQTDDLAVECREIVGLAARHPVAVADALLVAPVRAGIAEVVLQRRPARDR